MKITINHNITPERVSELLCSALEGGSNYWYSIPKIDGRELAEFIHEVPFKEGGALYIDDSVADDPTMKQPIKLDYKRIQRGLQLFATVQARHFNDFMTENDDANTADVFLQLCIFKKLIYA